MPKEERTTQSEITGLLGASSNFQGRILFTGTIRIDGQVTGDIICKDDKPSMVIITEHARVHANIIADVVVVAGSLIGNIKAIERLELVNPGRAEGLLYTSDLSIQDGALFQGECIMIRSFTELEKQTLKKEGFTQFHQSKMIRSHRNSIHEESA